jgi:hypothetical protein
MCQFARRCTSLAGETLRRSGVKGQPRSVPQSPSLQDLDPNTVGPETRSPPPTVFEAHGDFEPALLGAVGSNGADGEGGGDPETPGSRGCRGKKEHKREDYLLPIPLEKVTTQPLQVLQTASYYCLGRLILLYPNIPPNRPYPLRSLSYQPQQILFSFPPSS